MTEQTQSTEQVQAGEALSLEEILDDSKKSEKLEKPKDSDNSDKKESKDVKEEENKEGEPSAPKNTESEQEDNESWTKAMAFDERRKRQDIEKKLEKVQEELDSIKKGQSNKEKEEEKEPDPIDDPDAYKKYVDQKSYAARAKLSVKYCREKYSDFDETMKVAVQLCSENANINQSILNAEDPGETAYKIAKNHITSQKMSDPNFMETLRAELKQEILKELSSGKGSNQDKKPENKSKVTVPSSLSNTTSMNSDKAGDAFEHKSLEDIFQR